MATTTTQSGSAGAPPPDGNTTLGTALRQDNNATLAGATAAFTRLREAFPQIASMQGALVNGTVRSQRREAERLAKVYGKNDPRVARAAVRVESLTALQTEVMSNVGRVSRFATDIQRPGAFHGYVFQSNGAPAGGYTVRVEVKTPGQRAARRGKGKTDDNGFFSFALSGATPAPGQQATEIDRIIERARLAGAPPAASAPASAPAAEAPSAAPTTGAAADKVASTKPESVKLTSKVDVLDPAGTVVLSDPLPPTFDTMRSEFRLYALDAANKPAAAEPEKPTAKS